MDDVMLTSANSFEGYEIIEHLGFVNEQTALGSKLFQDMSFNDKLQQATSQSISKLRETARIKGGNAVIGVALNCNEFSSNTVGTIASGTVVIVKKKSGREAAGGLVELPVYNYYNQLMPRAVQVKMKVENGKVKIAPVFMNYKQEEVNAIRVDIELTNYFDEKLVLSGMDFVFSQKSDSILEADFVECKLAEKHVKVIKEVRVLIQKYVTPKGVFLTVGRPIDVTLNAKSIEALKLKRGIDAVVRYKNNGSTWTCNCGFVNEEGHTQCALCGRQEEAIKGAVSFDFEEMYAKMRTKRNVTEIKNVLMEYIKSIDSRYRMELLEIMESGLQYERTRGDMTGSVLERVAKVFDTM